MSQARLSLLDTIKRNRENRLSIAYYAGFSDAETLAIDYEFWSILVDRPIGLQRRIAQITIADAKAIWFLTVDHALAHYIFAVIRHAEYLESIA